MLIKIPEMPSPVIFEIMLYLGKIYYNNVEFDLPLSEYRIFILHNLNGKYIIFFNINGKLIHQIQFTYNALHCDLKIDHSNLYVLSK